MKSDSVDFPVCLQSPFGQNLYRILSSRSMEEIQIIGKKFQHHHIIARTLPDFNLISDLLNSDPSTYKRISEKTFERELSRCRKELKEIR